MEHIVEAEGIDQGRVIAEGTLLTLTGQPIDATDAQARPHGSAVHADRRREPAA